MDTMDRIERFRAWILVLNTATNEGLEYNTTTTTMCSVIQADAVRRLVYDDTEVYESLVGIQQTYIPRDSDEATSSNRERDKRRQVCDARRTSIDKGERAQLPSSARIRRRRRDAFATMSGSACPER